MMITANDTLNASIATVMAAPTTNSTSLEDEEFESLISKVVAVFFGFIGITGFIGNCSVVLVVLSNKQMRSTTNILIINLAAADLLFVIFCIPFTATDYIISMWPFGDAWCKIVQYLIVVTAHASIYTLVLMSLGKYAICWIQLTTHI
jgi:allatostatin A receptor